MRVLREGTRVFFEFECGDAYLAEVFREDIVEKTKGGHFRMSLKVKSVKGEARLVSTITKGFASILRHPD